MRRFKNHEVIELNKAKGILFQVSGNRF